MPPEPITSSRPAVPRGAWLAFLALSLLYSALAVAEMASLEATADEPTYFNSGRILLVEGWQQPIVRLHGPIPFFLNQLMVRDFPVTGYRVKDGDAALLLRGRLGLLPFAWLALALVFVWSARVFGWRSGLLCAALFALNPLMIGYGGLLAVDMVHAGAVLLCLYATWRYALAPGPLGLLAVGASLGLALGTKYLALLIVPCVGLAVVLATAAPARRARGAERARILLRAAAGGLAVGALALVVLHACYGFSVGFAPGDPAAYASRSVQRLVRLPVVGHVLALFPEPYLWGVDYQSSVGERPDWRSYADGRFGHGLKTYYLRAFLWKTPESVLLLVAWVCLRRGPAWLRGRATREERATVWLLVPTMLVVGGYLSLAKLQIGIRYVLPLYPMLFVLLGAAGLLPELRRARSLAALGVLVVGYQAVEVARDWPNLIAYFNRAAGGQAHAYRHFIDSNADWAQLGRTGIDELRASEPDTLEVLPRNSGPRFGRLAVKCPDLVRPDPEDPSRSRHWLDPIPFERHLGAAWWVFDVTPAAFEAAIARTGDERVRADFALALLGAGERERALAQVERLSPERAQPLRDLVQRLERAAQEGATAGDFDRLAQAWAAFDRYDLVEGLLRAHPRPDDSPWRLALARSIAMQHRPLEAIDVLMPHRGEDAASDMLAVALLFDARRFDEAADILERRLEGAAPEQATLLQEQLDVVRAEQRQHERFFRLDGR